MRWLLSVLVLVKVHVIARSAFIPDSTPLELSARCHRVLGEAWERFHRQPCGHDMHTAIEACDALSFACSSTSWGEDYERSRLFLHERTVSVCNSRPLEASENSFGMQTSRSKRTLKAAKKKLQHLARVERRKLRKASGRDASDVTGMTVDELEAAAQHVEKGQLEGDEGLSDVQEVVDSTNLADVSDQAEQGGTNIDSAHAKDIVTVEDMRSITEDVEGKALPLQENPANTYTDRHHVIQQGDMRFSMKGPQFLQTADRQVKVAAGDPWPDGTVVFCFARGISEAVQRAFLEAVEHLRRKKVCVSFKEIKPHQHNASCERIPSLYVQSAEAGTCWSDVGYLGSDGNAMNLGKGCESKGVVLHELGHTLGMDHEQARPDRDKYVKIQWENVKPGNEIQFAINPEAYVDAPYDFLSIMHYGTFTFGKDWKRRQPVITSTRGLVIPGLGQLMGLSKLDVKQLNDMYCPKDEGLQDVGPVSRTIRKMTEWFLR